jgi:hypothetical protein
MRRDHVDLKQPHIRAALPRPCKRQGAKLRFYLGLGGLARSGKFVSDSALTSAFGRLISSSFAMHSIGAVSIEGAAASACADDSISIVGDEVFKAHSLRRPVLNLTPCCLLFSLSMYPTIKQEIAIICPLQSRVALR